MNKRFLSIIIFLILASVFLIYKVCHSSFTCQKSLKSTQEVKLAPLESSERSYYHDYYGTSILDLDLLDAVMQDKIETVKKLLAQGANVNAVFGRDFPRYGFTPLAKAIKNKSLPMAELLIQAGADVNEGVDSGGIADDSNVKVKDDVRNNSLLAFAIILNEPEMVKLLIANGADVNAADPVFKKWTPLMIAHYNKRDEIVSLLREAGAIEK